MTVLWRSVWIRGMFSIGLWTSFTSCFIQAARFQANGPVLTVTLKDPDSDSKAPTKWLDLGALRPNGSWSVQSKGLLFPDQFPGLKGIKGSIMYNYLESAVRPSTVEAQVQLGHSAKDIDVILQPSFHLKSKTTSCLVQATHGNRVSFLARLSSRSKSILEHVKGSLVVDLPLQSMSAFKLSTSYDLKRRQPSCTMEGTTATGRTKAILKLDSSHPTLTVVQSIDRRNTIAPELSLRTAKILYTWKVNLDNSGSSIQTKVDPTSAIHLTWTDRSPMRGKWVTDLTLPLTGTTIAQTASNLRVRRQFSF